MLSLVLAGAVFVLVHIGIAGTPVRDRLVGAMGSRGYMILFSALSVGTIVWLASAYKRAEYVPLWGQPEWWKVVAIVLMLPAFLLVVIGLTTANPTSVGQEGRTGAPVRGMLRVTRHPFLMGVALWATLHLVANGDVASVVLFGSLLVVAAAGAPSIDAKRRRALGSATWEGFASQTSILPFGAIVQGRNRFVAAEFSWWRPLLGVVAYALFLGGHVHIIGVSPFPHF